VALLESIHWVVYAFGAILLFTAYHVFRHENFEVHPDHNPVVRAANRVLPSVDSYRGHRFFVREDGKLKVTPLVVVLIAVESVDVVSPSTRFPPFSASRGTSFSLPVWHRWPTALCRDDERP
jgi:tellurite resistance protein TerC